MNNLDQITSTQPARHLKMVSFISLIQDGLLHYARMDKYRWTPCPSFYERLDLHNPILVLVFLMSRDRCGGFVRVILCQQLRRAFSVIARGVWHATCIDYGFDEVQIAQRSGIVERRASILAFPCIRIGSGIE